MATFLDIGLLGKFNVIFTFLFVYAIVYGLLEYGKIFGDGGPDGRKGIHAIIALAIAFVSVISKPISALISFMIPWFFILALVIFFIIFAIKIFTGDKYDISRAITTNSQVYTWIIVIAIVIMIFGLGKAFGSDTLKAGGWDGTTSVEEPNDGMGDYATETSGGDSMADKFIDETGIGNSQLAGTPGSTATSDYSKNVLNTIVNPKVLGMIFVLLVGVFAIFFLAD